MDSQSMLENGKHKAKAIPAFLQKLLQMLEQEDYINWSSDGLSFSVTSQTDFCEKVLPKYFKHNNFTSFIRQLNMYGFHKILPLSQLENQMEFKHDQFNKHEQKYEKINRRKQEEVAGFGLKEIILELSQIKRHQVAINNEIIGMKRENQDAWTQSLLLQQEYEKQKDTIEKILGFLAQVFSKKDLDSFGASFDLEHGRGESGTDLTAFTGALTNTRSPVASSSNGQVLTRSAAANQRTTQAPQSNLSQQQLTQQSSHKQLAHNQPNLTITQQAKKRKLLESILNINIDTEYNDKLKNVENDMDLLQDRIFDITNNINDFTDNGFFPFESDLGKGLDDLNSLQNLNESSLNELSGQGRLSGIELDRRVNTEALFAGEHTGPNSLIGLLGSGNGAFGPLSHCLARGSTQNQLTSDQFAVLQNNVNLQSPVNIQKTFNNDQLKKGSLVQIQKGLSKPNNNEVLDLISPIKEDELDFDDFFNV
jgi:hypothetical protein